MAQGSGLTILSKANSPPAQDRYPLWSVAQQSCLHASEVSGTGVEGRVRLTHASAPKLGVYKNHWEERASVLIDATRCNQPGEPH